MSSIVELFALTSAALILICAASILIGMVLWHSWYRDMQQYVPPQFRGYNQRATLHEFINDPNVPDELRQRHKQSSYLGLAFATALALLGVMFQNPPLIILPGGLAIFSAAIGVSKLIGKLRRHHEG